MKQNILVSVRGGKTSMMLAVLMNEKYGHSHNIIYVFANTGFEHPETLDFVRRFEIEAGIPIVWVEAVTHKGRIACTHKVVSFDTADRNGMVFESVVEEYGLPNKSYPHCNREMKLHPIHSYAKTAFGGKYRFVDYSTAIGIRMDEMDRQMQKAEKNNFIYPLISEFKLYKQDILDYWENKDWRINIPENYGNCLTCFKKSNRKLATIGREPPRVVLLL